MNTFIRKFKIANLYMDYPVIVEINHISIEHTRFLWLGLMGMLDTANMKKGVAARNAT